MRWALGLAVGLLGCAPGQREPVEPSPGTASELRPDSPATVEPEPATASLLNPVAFREGRIEIAGWADEAFAIIDGEPIPLSPGQAVSRDPPLGRGLLPDKAFLGSTHELIAFGGTLTGDAPTAHVVIAEHFERSGSDYFSYAREPDRWARVKLAKRGSDLAIETHYAAFVAARGATDSALLGLRRYTMHSDVWDYGDDDPEIDKQLRKLGRELGKAPRGFTVLAGSPAVTPTLPKGMDATDAVSLETGEIIALGHHHRTRFEGDDGPARILTWASGEREPSVTELPGLDDPSIYNLAIWAAGDVVIVGGLRDIPDADDRPYLAVRESDGRWTEVTLDLPTALHERVGSATRTSTGELWIVIGARNYASDEPCGCLWRKPSDGPWANVELEPLTLFRDAEARWVHVLSEQSWIEVPAGTPPPLHPAPRHLLWAEGAIWLTADLGPSYPTSTDFILSDPRSLLYSSVSVNAPRELLSTDQLYDERFDRQAATAKFVPGSDDCRTFHMVLADEPEPVELEQLVEQLAQLADIATIENDDGWASASIIYVGELDGRAQLVVEASSWNPKSATALADAFTQVLGRRPTLDCRPRKLIRAVKVLR